MSFTQANVLGVSITNPVAAPAAFATQTGIAVTGITVGWQIHLAFYLLTLGVALITIVSFVRPERFVVVDQAGNQVVAEV